MEIGEGTGRHLINSQPEAAAAVRWCEEMWSACKAFSWAADQGHQGHQVGSWLHNEDRDSSPIKVKMKKTNPESNRDRYDRFRSHRINLLNWSVVPGPPHRSSGSQVAIQQLQDARPDARSHLLAFLLGTRESNSYRTTVASKTGWKIGIPVIAWYEFMIVKLISLMYTYVQSPINQLVKTWAVAFLGHKRTNLDVQPLLCVYIYIYCNMIRMYKHTSFIKWYMSIYIYIHISIFPTLQNYPVTWTSRQKSHRFGCMLHCMTVMVIFVNHKCLSTNIIYGIDKYPLNTKQVRYSPYFGSRIEFSSNNPQDEIPLRYGPPFQKMKIIQYVRPDLVWDNIWFIPITGWWCTYRWKMMEFVSWDDEIPNSYGKSSNSMVA